MNDLIHKESEKSGIGLDVAMVLSQALSTAEVAQPE